MDPDGKPVRDHDETEDHEQSNAMRTNTTTKALTLKGALSDESRVLATLKANDEENRNRCIYRGHISIVIDLLRQSILDSLKGNGFVLFLNSQIQNVAFLHDLNLSHASEDGRSPSGKKN
ncbi:hypothetical protein ACQKWADRAFT_326513 [Trichoderma austrokoningii]